MTNDGDPDQSRLPDVPEGYGWGFDDDEIDHAPERGIATDWPAAAAVGWILCRDRRVCDRVISDLAPDLAAGREKGLPITPTRLAAIAGCLGASFAQRSVEAAITDLQRKLVNGQLIARGELGDIPRDDWAFWSIGNHPPGGIRIISLRAASDRVRRSDDKIVFAAAEIMRLWPAGKKRQRRGPLPSAAHIRFVALTEKALAEKGDIHIDNAIGWRTETDLIDYVTPQLEDEDYECSPSSAKTWAKEGLVNFRNSQGR